MTWWRLDLLRVYYTIHHIDGSYNYLADLGSRWGNRFAKRRSEAQQEPVAGLKRGLHRGPAVLMTGLINPEPVGETVAVPKRVMWLSHPKVSDDTTKPDLDLKEALIMPDE